MVISTHAMIAYDQQQLPMLPGRSENPLVFSEATVERHHRFQRPPRAQITAADPGDIDCNRYDSNQCWQYADDYQIGGRLDVYA
ncbi:MAG: hypothetical protein PVI38_03715 [Desulfobacterales bacterium]|jgi:hypothetical protein